MARLVIVLLVLCLPRALSAQGIGTVLRAGAGLDGGGATVAGGQVELVDFGAASSAEVAAAAFSASSVEDYHGLQPGPFGDDVPHDYHEETHVRGVGLVGSILIGHGPRESRGPYLALGLGLGALDVDWHVESPTDDSLGTRRPTGGSVRAEERVLLGGLGSVGLGWRVHRRVDVRAQMLTLMAPSTNDRENAKVLAAFTLTAGVGI